MWTIEKIIEKISKEKDLTKKEVLEKIRGKKEELDGLVSLNGAGYIIANELDVHIPGNSKRKRLLIKNVVSGMKNAEICGKVLRIFKTINFEKDGKKGKVCSLILSDGTGSVRLSLWNKQVDEYIKNEKIKEGGKLKVKGYVKKGKYGLEIRLGKRGKIEVDPDIKIPGTRSNIKDLKPKEYGQIKAIVTRIYMNKPFFEVCPECNSRLEKNVCEKHGEVDPKAILVLNALLENRTGKIKAVFWRESVEKFIKIKKKDLITKYKKGKLEKVRDIEGKEFIFTGRVKFNEDNKSKELVVYKTEQIKPIKESKLILEEINKEFNN